MRVVICCPVQEFTAVYAAAAIDAGMTPDTEPLPQEFGSQLYRDPDAMGVMWAAGPASAAMTIRKIREGDIKSRIIVLAERTKTPAEFSHSLVQLLAAGADDAQPADIDVRELAARLKAIARRGTYFDHRYFDFCGGRFDSDLGEYRGPFQTVHLTIKERDFLVALARNQDRVMSKGDLIDAVYGFGDDAPLDKIVDVFICKIRDKVAKATGGLDVINTVWGRGYQFNRDGYAPALASVRVRQRA